MRVTEVMTAEIIATRMGTGTEEVARKMQQHHVGMIPVCDDEQRVIGVVTDRDFTVRVVASGRDPGMILVEEIMSKDVVACFEDQSLEDCVNLMETRGMPRLPVLNSDRRLVGWVSLLDLALRAKDEPQVKEALRKLAEAAEG